MLSYNENNGGIPSRANPWLLKEILRKEWGFTGLTVPDYTAVQELHIRHHLVESDAAAGVLALKSGVDAELPTPAAFPGLVDAVRSDKLNEKQLEEAETRDQDAF